MPDAASAYQDSNRFYGGLQGVACGPAPAHPRRASDDDARRGELGLSYVHISPRHVSASSLLGHAYPVVSFADGGSYIRYSSPRPVAVSSRGSRGRIRGFSKGSRRRLLRWFNSLHRDKAGLPLMVTLTYRVHPDPAKAKRDLDCFIKRLRRRYPTAWGSWRMEPQKRGAIHFHLLVFGVFRIPRDWLSAVWAEIVGDPAVERAGTRVEVVRSWRGVMSYAAKYLAKVSDTGFTDAAGNPLQYVGRHWGVFGRDLVPIRVVTLYMAWSMWYRFRRLCRRYLRARGYDIPPRSSGFLYAPDWVAVEMINHALGVT